VSYIFLGKKKSIFEKKDTSVVPFTSRSSSLDTSRSSSSSSLLSSPMKAHSCRFLKPRIIVKEAPGHLKIVTHSYLSNDIKLIIKVQYYFE